jgi:hypothetical protein
MNRAAEKAAIGTPLSSVFHRSASVPLTRVIGAEKAIPSIVRQTRSVWIFGANAQGIVNMTARRSVMPYVLRRPSTLDRDAKPWDLQSQPSTSCNTRGGLHT